MLHVTSFLILDVEVPAIESCPTDMELETDPGKATAMVVYQTPTATDNSGEVSVVCNPASGSQFPIGQTTVTCVTGDNSKNNETCDFVVDIKEGITSESPTSNAPSSSEPTTTTTTTNSNHNGGSTTESTTQGSTDPDSTTPGSTAPGSTTQDLTTTGSTTPESTTFDLSACSSALGMENKQIPDSRITSDKFYSGYPNLPSDGRLNDLSACSSALGMENHQIPDSRITSEKDHLYFYTNRACKGRLNGITFWDTSTTSSSWMQVYLGLTTAVAGLVTQGNDPNWVMSYYVQMQSFGRELKYITHELNNSYTSKKV
ncbi:uncharacterized protein [Amphiura filiformis]|uniref:uncharacterized protein n=1 Tax=Amphiura filiformis TaxID=82378 RepID=UPI003B21B1B8